MPNLSDLEEQRKVHLSDLLYQRCGHFSKPKIFEAYKHMMLFTGRELESWQLTKRYIKSISRHICKSCADA